MSERDVEPGTMPAAPKVTTATLRYHGTGGSLFGLVLVNGLLTIVTLGFYSFWGKTKVRAFHYSHTEMDGDRFAYHGTGGELLSGWLKAIGIFFVIFLAVGIMNVMLTSALGGAPEVAAILGLAVYAIMGLLIPLIVNGARRYRLSRSSWRGIRFSYHGQWPEYLRLNVVGALLSIVTLGFYLPTYQNDRQKYFIDHVRFGSEPFHYTGTGREMFGEYVKALLLTIPTLGLSWIWYAAFKNRYFWANTTMRGARFRSTVSGGELIGFSLVNILLTACTLGLGVPWVMTRTHAFYCDRLTLRGTVDWATIEQRAQTAGSAAEGLADAFDVDIGIG